MEYTVWIIDDDLVSQFATEYSVQQAKHTVTITRFDSATESLTRLLKCHDLSEAIPDVILLDLVMPEMDGWEFLKEVKKISDFKDKINVFVISSFSKSKDRDLARRHPLVKGYFDKPLSNLSVDKIFETVEAHK